MARYSVNGADTNTVDTTIVGLVGGTTVRPAVYDVLIGHDATPADSAFRYVLQRTTTAGTSTAVTPQALDSADPAAITTAGKAHSAEPTYTSNAVLLDLPMNQRATMRWVASPGGELIIPATANNGIGVIPRVGGSVNCNVCIHFSE